MINFHNYNDFEYDPDPKILKQKERERKRLEQEKLQKDSIEQTKKIQEIQKQIDNILITALSAPKIQFKKSINQFLIPNPRIVYEQQKREKELEQIKIEEALEQIRIEEELERKRQEQVKKWIIVVIIAVILCIIILVTKMI